MSDIERYRITAISPDAARFAKHPNGEWVSHEDAAAEIARLQSLIPSPEDDLTAANIERERDRMWPVYEAAMAYWRAVRGCAETRSDPDSDPDAERAIIQAEDDTFQTLMQRCRAADSDREGEE